MALFMGKAPSLNQMYYATQEEFYDEWRENFPVEVLNPYQFVEKWVFLILANLADNNGQHGMEKSSFED